jgi:hypothetical protein
MCYITCQTKVQILFSAWIHNNWEKKNIDVKVVYYLVQRRDTGNYMQRKPNDYWIRKYPEVIYKSIYLAHWT